MSQRLFGDDIKFQQRFLKTAGLYDGNIDGDWGPRTDAADQAFAAETARIANELGRFDSRTEANLHTLHLPVQRAARMFLRRVRDAAIDARIISGTRSYAEQDRLFRHGRFGNPGPVVTKARGGQSWHNFGLAWDIGIFNGGRYLGDSPLYVQVAQIDRNGSLEWGGDWTGFVDRPHYQQLPGALQLAEVRSRFEAGQTFFA